MPVESEVIPFEPAALRGERLMVLAPHPDDEVIACGGLVAQHIREMRPVRVVVATDGAAADASRDRDAYRSTREEECRRGLEALGGAEVDFLRLQDRELSEHEDQCRDRLRSLLHDFRPTLILVPSPIEIHPDHAALAAIFCTLIQRDPELFADLAVAQVAFYEVTQPIRPNAIVDISDVAEAKYAAIGAHVSQAGLRDYAAFSRGLGAYRAMTMPPGTSYAEAYYVVPLPELRTTAVGQLQAAMGNARRVLTVERESPRISVIVRTQNRPELLREAIESIRATAYPAEIVVVNDGGSPVDWLNDGTREPVRLLSHEQPRGRAEAANAGVRAASSEWVAFLDDDDLYYPEHLATLSRATLAANRPAYSDAVSAFLRMGESGRLETHSRLRLFAQDFDPELLLVDNYIPLPTLLLPRALFLDLGGFDSQFELFEDWDFLIRLSAKTPFVHVPRVTCEIRHVESSGSIVLSAPEGSAAFRDAKLKVWRKHAPRLTPDLFATVFERQKRAAGTRISDAVEQRGLVHHMQTNVARLEREKGQLIAQMQLMQNSVNEQTIRAEATAVALRETQAAFATAQSTVVSQSTQLEELSRLNVEYRSAVDETQTTVRALYAEIHRLQTLLDTIYTSKTWKLHNLVEKVRGR